ncbi:unnamed protein product [Darwinula stevensoni]|uniref:Glucosylceramidase n=1 Tax=Darwinula stevensoni TaxID=69355 RepID=A0A7R8X1S4_9CRUS|nr:unnamed protein product [Darwinula stevensoni]CAG0882577.1 unnamed protein product [Darwinula stevensoni]
MQDWVFGRGDALVHELHAAGDPRHSPRDVPGSHATGNGGLQRQPWEHRVYLGSWVNGEKCALDIIQNLYHWMVGWIDWNMSLDLLGGPNWGGFYVDSPIVGNATAGEYYKNPTYYAILDILVNCPMVLLCSPRKDTLSSSFPTDLLEKSEEDEGSEYVRVQDAFTASRLSSCKYEDVTWGRQETVNHMRRAAILADACKACELKARGWKFLVLNNAFMVHDGFKITTKFDFVWNKEIRKDLALTAINHRLYRAELIAKIWSQAKKCSSLYYRSLEVFLVLARHLSGIRVFQNEETKKPPACFHM